jgi:hypothetical protein
MKRLKLNHYPKAVGLLLLILMTVVLARSAHAQQEVDPTWFNPWPEPGMLAKHRTLSPAANRQQQKNSSVSSRHLPPQRHARRQGNSRVRNKITS